MVGYPQENLTTPLKQVGRMRVRHIGSRHGRPTEPTKISQHYVGLRTAEYTAVRVPSGEKEFLNGVDHIAPWSNELACAASFMAPAI